MTSVAEAFTISQERIDYLHAVPSPPEAAPEHQEVGYKDSHVEMLLHMLRNSGQAFQVEDFCTIAEGESEDERRADAADFLQILILDPWSQGKLRQVERLDDRGAAYTLIKISGLLEAPAPEELEQLPCPPAAASELPTSVHTATLPEAVDTEQGDTDDEGERQTGDEPIALPEEAATESESAEGILPAPLDKQALARAVAASRTASLPASRRGRRQPSSGASVAPPSRGPRVSAQNKLQPSPEFTAALKDDHAEVIDLTQAGLRVVTHGDEKHLFLAEKHIPLPAASVNTLMIHLVALHADGMMLDQVVTSMRQLIPNKYVPAGQVREQLQFLDGLLREEGIGLIHVYGKNPVNRRTVYKLEGTIRRAPSEWPDCMAPLKPRPAPAYDFRTHTRRG